MVLKHAKIKIQKHSYQNHRNSGKSMRLIEEKILVVLSIFAIFIIGFTLMIQIADSEINEYNNDLFIRQGKINNILLHRLEASQNTNQFNLYELFQPDVILPKKNTLTELNLTGNRYNEIHNKFKNGEIDKKEFVYKMTELYQDEYEALFILYDSEWKEVERRYAEGTPWVFWKNVFVFFEVVFVVLSFLGYSYLYIKIKNRVYDKKTS